MGIQQSGRQRPLVEPVYKQITWVGQVAYGLCYEYDTSGGTGGIGQKYYDIYIG